MIIFIVYIRHYSHETSDEHFIGPSQNLTDTSMYIKKLPPPHHPSPLIYTFNTIIKEHKLYTIVYDYASLQKSYSSPLTVPSTTINDMFDLIREHEGTRQIYFFLPSNETSLPIHGLKNPSNIWVLPDDIKTRDSNGKNLSKEEEGGTRMLFITTEQSLRRAIDLGARFIVIPMSSKRLPTLLRLHAAEKGNSSPLVTTEETNHGDSLSQSKANGFDLLLPLLPHSLVHIVSNHDDSNLNWLVYQIEQHNRHTTPSRHVNL